LQFTCPARVAYRPFPAVFPGTVIPVVRTLIDGSAYDGSKASRDLGLVYTPIETTLRRTVRWYMEQGLILRPLPGFTESPTDAPRPA